MNQLTYDNHISERAFLLIIFIFFNLLNRLLFLLYFLLFLIMQLIVIFSYYFSLSIKLKIIIILAFNNYVIIIEYNTLYAKKVVIIEVLYLL